jgi:ABC-type glycerol-3-phosphate transport system permease component
MSPHFLLGIIAGIVAGYGILRFETNVILAVAGGFVISVVMWEAPVFAMFAYLGLEYYFRGVLTEYSAAIVGIAILSVLLRKRYERN